MKAQAPKLKIHVNALILLLLSTISLAEFPIETENVAERPAVSGDIVVWQEDSDIYGYNLSTQTKFPICTESSDQNSPAVSGDIVVWVDSRSGRSDIYGYNLSTQTEFSVCTESSYQSLPAVCGDVVVWIDERNDPDEEGNYDIYGYNLSTQTEFAICTQSSYQYSPAISGDVVVWTDNRNGYSDIYGYNLTTQTEFPICTATRWQTSPAISGDIVVWEDHRDNNSDIYGYNLTTQTEFFICTRGNDESAPSVSGNIVVWQHTNNIHYDIYGYDIIAQTVFPISTMPGSQNEPVISGDIIVWRFSNGLSTGLFGYEYKVGAECYLSTEVFESTPYEGSTDGALGWDVTSCGYADTKDVWHHFTPNLTGDYTVSLCGSDFDTTLAVFDDCNGAEIICNDEYCGKQSQVTLKARDDVTYKIRVAGYDDQTGNYVLTILGPDDCINPPDMDSDGDCRVDMVDFAALASEWLTCGYGVQENCWE